MKRAVFLVLVCSMVAQQRLPADQIAPNPNPAGNTINVSGTNSNEEVFQNFGTFEIQSFATLTNGGTLTNESGGALCNDILGTLTNINVVDNLGTLTNVGTLDNISTLTNHATLTNDMDGVLRNIDGLTIMAR